MTAPLDDPLQLLLASAGDYHPALADGLPAETLETAKKPKHKASPLKDKRDVDPNDLPAQRWGVIAPKGSVGGRLLEAVAPLIRLREGEQGAKPKEYRVEADMDAETSIRFREDEYRAENVPNHERPRYLLILGDLDQVSLELQHALANTAFVGRLAFTDATGDPDHGAYNAYAEKVVDLTERPSPEQRPDAYFFTARDGTAATNLAATRLVGPCLTRAKEHQRSGNFPAASIGEIEAASLDDLLRAAAGSRPSVLFTASHGLGAPRGGWKNIDQQRALQGALALGGSNVLRAEEIVKKPFLPGGMWFCLACFGAGTPAESVYYPWLMDLAKEGAYEGRLDAVLTSLPKGGQLPFVAALPQAALANREGPLAVIGHADLAWSYAYSRGKSLSEGSSQKIFSVIETLVNGSRAGVALDTLMDFYRETIDALRTSYDREKKAETRNQPNPTDRKDRAHLWMLSNDLRGYMLLGDPAARLPLRRPGESSPKAAPSAPEIRSAPAPEDKASAAPAVQGEISIERKVAVVRALLQGDETPRALAAKAGVSLPELWAWFDEYHAGGKERLGG
jgi:hypothetical protein